MTKLRRCSPEIERELHDKEARIRDLEAATGEIDAIACEFASCDDHQTWRAMKDIHEIIRDAPVHTAPPDSESAEEAEKCLVCDGTGNLYGRQPEGMYGYLPCHNCKGTGKPPMRETAEEDT